VKSSQRSGIDELTDEMMISNSLFLLRNAKELLEKKEWILVRHWSEGLCENELLASMKGVHKEKQA
jgi:hypothetical protein